MTKLTYVSWGMKDRDEVLGQILETPVALGPWRFEGREGPGLGAGDMKPKSGFPSWLALLRTHSLHRDLARESSDTRRPAVPGGISRRTTLRQVGGRPGAELSEVRLSACRSTTTTSPPRASPLKAGPWCTTSLTCKYAR